MRLTLPVDAAGNAGDDQQDHRDGDDAAPVARRLLVECVFLLRMLGRRRRRPGSGVRLLRSERRLGEIGRRRLFSRRLEIVRRRLFRRGRVHRRRQRLGVGDMLVGRTRGPVGLGGALAQAFGLGHGLAEIAQGLIAQRGAGRRRDSLRLLRLRVGDGLGLDPADRLFERQPLARDLVLVERRIDAAQLIDQRRTRALVQSAAVLAGIAVETADGAGDQWVIISHRASLCLSRCLPETSSPRRNAVWPRFMSFFSAHSNGFFIRIVSSRSGLVDSSATGQPTSSSTRRTYLMACAGSCAQERARAVGSFQPAMVS